MKELAHYSVDVRSLSPENQSEIFKQLSGSCWTADFTNIPGVFDVYWEIGRGDFSLLPYLSQNCVINKLH